MVILHSHCLILIQIKDVDHITVHFCGVYIRIGSVSMYTQVVLIFLFLGIFFFVLTWDIEPPAIMFWLARCWLAHWADAAALDCTELKGDIWRCWGLCIIPCGGGGPPVGDVKPPGVGNCWVIWTVPRCCKINQANHPVVNGAMSCSLLMFIIQSIKKKSPVFMEILQKLYFLEGKNLALTIPKYGNRIWKEHYWRIIWWKYI